MGRFVLLSLIAFMIVFPAACESGDSSEVLQLDTGPFTEDEFLIQIRQNVLARPRVMTRICENLGGLPNAEAVASFTAANYMASRTPIASPDPVGESRAAKILRAECAHLLE